MGDWIGRLVGENMEREEWKIACELSRTHGTDYNRFYLSQRLFNRVWVYRQRRENVEARDWGTGVCFERAFFADYCGGIQSAKPWILASASQDGTMRLWHAYKHSGEQSAAVADVHAMVSEKNDNENANGNNDNNNDTNNPPEGQQQRRQQQNRGGRLPRTQLTQVITLSFNCDGTAICGGTDTCHPSSSRLFCYDFDLSKIKEESRGEAPPLDSLSAYDLSNFYNRKILEPLNLAVHRSRVDVTKFSNTDARIFISGSADGYVMCWQLPPKPESNDRIKLKKGNRMRDDCCCVFG